MDHRVTEMIERDDRPKWSSHSNHNIKCFTEGELGRITSNYGSIIGKGGFGEVYMGVLEDGSIVAVKRFVRNVEEDFAKELKVHSEINHKNVVRLIGYCAEENALMIVTEYMSKGNLSHVLHHDCIPIPLDTRLRIAVECSEALCYVHSQMYTHVIHGDIKPANILLDDNLNAKISDFGISRLVNTDSTRFTEHVIGSIGYMDPLFARYGRLTSKSDVYSFGIVLLELITKKKATVRKGEINIVECFTQALATGIRMVRELFDVEISSQDSMKVLEGVAKLAGECLRMEMDRRPEMTDVAGRLRALRKTQAKGKHTLTIFPWGWKNKPSATQNNGQSSGASAVHVPQSLPSLPLEKSNLIKAKKKFFERNGGLILVQQMRSYNGTTDGLRIFTTKELEKATNNFAPNQILGHGSHGMVHRGVLADNSEVAIKKSSMMVEAGTKEFTRAMLILSQINHRNIVKLLGCCLEVEVPILVYEYVSNGTLYNYIHGGKGLDADTALDTRLRIGAESAEGLAYMHSSALEPILHGDVKTANILLDESLTPKVTDFGGLAQSHEAEAITTLVHGTCGYLDPEYFMTCRLTDKSDVYSFGVVLLEMLTRKKVLCLDGPEENRSLVSHFVMAVKAGRHDELMDDSVRKEMGPEALEEVTNLLMQCVSMNSNERPGMKEVAERLEALRRYQRHP